MSADSQGSQARLYVEPGAADHTFDSSSESYEFVSESLRRESEILYTDGIRGTRSHAKETLKNGVYRVQGDIVLTPSPADLDLWLPRILGAAESTDVFALAETLPAFGVLVDRVAQTFEYTDCKVNRATFLSSGGDQLLRMTLNIIGRTEVPGTSAPTVALGIAANNAPYVHSESVVTLESAARDTKLIEITIDNHLDPRISNSRTVNSLEPQDRTITLRTVHPFADGSEEALYAAMEAGSGAAGSVVYTNGNLSTTFAFANLTAPPNSPVVSGKSAIDLELTMRATMSSTTRELVVTNDSNAGA